MMPVSSFCVALVMVLSVRAGPFPRTNNSTGNTGSAYIPLPPYNTPASRSIQGGSTDQDLIPAQNLSQHGANPAGSKIVFPGETESSDLVQFKPEVNGPRPKCAADDSFCENVENYPQDYIRKLLENDVNVGPGFKDYVRVEVDTRIQPEDQIYLCASVEQVVFPNVAQNKEDKWLYVVNQDSHVQGVRVEKCQKQDKCKFTENFPSGYTSSCQQKYIYRKLLALGEDGQPVTDSFRLPSCCSCVVTKLYPMARMGDLGKMTPVQSRRRRR